MSISKTIAAPANLTFMYAEMMLKGITPATFARLASPAGIPIKSNHPAWVYGHCALYNERILTLLDQPIAPAANPAGWDALFKNGTECLDDPKGTIYPAMEAVTTHFVNGFKAALAAVASASDHTLNEPNPGEGRMKELFPTKGPLIAFLLTGHPMSHLGQVSAWRRMMGLPSAM